MNKKLIGITWCVCIILTLLTSGWPMFNHDYMMAIWILSGTSSIVLTDVMLTKTTDVNYDLQLNCSIIAAMCVLFTIVFGLVIVWGWLNEINDNFVTLSKCVLCVLAPIGIVTEQIATWKQKK